MADNLPNKASTQPLINPASQNLKPTVPKVSVIMNCLNGAQYLREAIDSVYAQTFKDWEIIFWDNASTDNSAEIALAYDGNLRYFRGEQAVSLYAARNLALKQAKSKYIALLDCDDIWLPEKLEKQIPLLERKPEIGLVFSNSVMFNQLTGKEWLHGSRCAYHRGMVFNKLLTDYYLPLLTVVVRRQCLDNMGEWFDDRFNIAGDADLFTRIAYSWEVDFVSEPLARCRMHSESLTWSRSDLLGRELKMMLDKYRTLYENFELRYRKELKKAEAKIAYYEAVQEWKKAATSGTVRRMIVPHMLYFPKLLAFYFMTFFPYAYFIRTMRLLNKHP